MKIKDLLPMNIDIDVVDNVCEELYIAFCGPMALTEEGKHEFADVLEYGIEIGNEVIIVDIDDDDEEVWEKRLRKAKRFFLALAGYCSCEQYDKWFIDVEE